MEPTPTDRGSSRATGSLDATIDGASGEPARADPIRIGAHVIEDRIGAGSMGVVYRARDDRLGRHVAVKLLARVGARNRRRIVREARALAQLSDPNVVQVFEAGEVDGRPYVVMELVEGQPLRAWLDASAHTVPEILAAFRQAGAGLAAAHRRGIVHRDFKPENVIVGRDRRIRVVDFGLARAEADADAAAPRIDPTPSVDATLDAFAGTPAYSAPECFALRPATSASDQFSFCVALYEALYHRHPFGDRADGVASLASRIVAGVVVEPPSVRGVPRRVRAAVLRGLRSDPAQRWPTMDLLLAELEPAARSMRPWLLALVGGATIAAAFAWPEPGPKCSDADDRLHALWGEEQSRVREALVEAMDANGGEVWSALHPRMDAYATRWADAHREACTRAEQDAATVDAMMTCLDQRRQQFETLVSLATEADATIARGLLDAVVELVPADACIGDRLTIVDGPPPELSTRVSDGRRSLARAQLLVELGKHDEGSTLARSVLEKAEAIGYAPLVVEASRVVARGAVVAGDYVEGERLTEAAFYAAKAIDHHEVAAQAALGLAWIHSERLHRLDDAELWLRHAEAQLEHVDDPGASLKARTYRIVFARHRADAQTTEAEVARALAQLDAAPEIDPLVRAGILNNAGAALYAANRVEASRDAFERGLAALSPPHDASQLRGELLHNYAHAVSQLDGYAAALPIAQQAVAAFEQSLGPDHPNVAAAWGHVAEIQRMLGNTRESLQPLRRALEIRSARGDDVATALTQAQLGVVLFDLEQRDEARSLLAKAHTSLSAALGSADQRVLTVSFAFAEVLREEGRFEEARTLLRDAVDRDAFDAARLGDQGVLAPALLAWTELALGDTDSALEHARMATTACATDCTGMHGLAPVALAVALFRSGGDPTTVAAPPFTLSDHATRTLQPVELDLLAQMRASVTTGRDVDRASADRSRRERARPR